MHTHQDLYCNPVPLPSLQEAFSSGTLSADGGFTDTPVCFRDCADPEVLYVDGKWYMYPSQGQAYVSDDLRHWEYHPIDIEYPLGFAPGVTCRNGRFFLTSSPHLKERVARIFEAPSPLGPFRFIGSPVDMEGNPLEHYLDPALFTDDDGRMYLYWGCAPAEGGIYGMEVNPERPWQGISPIKTLIQFNGNHFWERMGDYGEITDFGWDEGVSMFKHNGKYLLLYSANGTVCRHYTIACYMGDSPLGPFREPDSPVLMKSSGIVCGTGHGGMFPGPDGSVWLAYTTTLHRQHHFERRVAIDPVRFDSDGAPHVTPSDAPCSVSAGDIGLVPVSYWKIARCTSRRPGSSPFQAIDECPHTCWMPERTDTSPVLTINLRNEFDIHAFRIIWAELNLDYAKGILPEPVLYRILFRDSNGTSTGEYDASLNDRELNVDFRVLNTPVPAMTVELHILKRNGSPLEIGVTDFALFAPPAKHRP